MLIVSIHGKDIGNEKILCDSHPRIAKAYKPDFSMRLINTVTLKLESFEGTPPNYACLSHRWGIQEISFQQWRTRNHLLLRSKSGYKKITAACRCARKFGINYLWVDTCCIDKTSSAELSEAINSMWSWYRYCQICIVYLADVNDSLQHSKLVSHDDYNLSSSTWFTRAWTLQELLAPYEVMFYNSHWHLLGDKRSLLETIVQITSIDRLALTTNNHKHWSVASKMSWAASRGSTRIEDQAYSLMGLMDVNMPLLYGEGSKAFVRLQEEIMRRSTDTSVLAWGLARQLSVWQENFPLYASTPESFAATSDVEGLNAGDLSLRRLNIFYAPTYFNLNNLGLSTKLWISPWMVNTYLALVGRSRTEIDCFTFIRVHSIDGTPLMARIHSRTTSMSVSQIKKHRLAFQLSEVVLLANPHPGRCNFFNGLQLQITDEPSQYNFRTMGLERNTWSMFGWQEDWPSKWTKKSMINHAMAMGKGYESSGTVGMWMSSPVFGDGRRRVVLFGFNQSFYPMCLTKVHPVAVIPRSEDEVIELIQNCLNCGDISAWTRSDYKWAPDNKVVPQASCESTHVQEYVPAIHLAVQSKELCVQLCHDRLLRFFLHSGAWTVRFEATPENRFGSRRDSVSSLESLVDRAIVEGNYNEKYLHWIGLEQD